MFSHLLKMLFYPLTTFCYNNMDKAQGSQRPLHTHTLCRFMYVSQWYLSTATAA